MESRWATQRIPEISCKLKNTRAYFESRRGNVSRCDQKSDHVDWVSDIGRRRHSCLLSRSLESVFTFTLSILEPALQSTEERCPVDESRGVSGQTSRHYTDTGLELCCFQQITTVTDDRKQEYIICISGSRHSSLKREVKAWLWLEYTENTQNKPISWLNWHPHKGINKGMYLWASGSGSARSVHW